MTGDEICILAEYFEHTLELREKSKATKFTALQIQQFQGLQLTNKSSYHFKFKRPDLYNSGPQAHVTSLNRQDTGKGTVPKENKC